MFIIPSPYQIDQQLESGEYFLSDDRKKAKKWMEKQGKQAEKIAKNKRKREEAFVPPEVWCLRFKMCLLQNLRIFLILNCCFPILQEPTKPNTGASTNERNDDVAAMALSLKVKVSFGYRAFVSLFVIFSYLLWLPCRKKPKSTGSESPRRKLILRPSLLLLASNQKRKSLNTLRFLLEC